MPLAKAAALTIAGTTVEPGSRATLDVPLARLYTRTDLTMPVHVINARRPGPRLFVSGVVHGDEILGVEIIRRLLQRKALERLRGALLAVPVVNVYGFLDRSRYLPDRRDLNRHFPGSSTGSLAAQLAQRFMEHVVAHATHGIDLHTGSNHRTNLPQIRACLDDPETEAMATAFGAPVIIDASLRDGSLREAVREHGIPVLLYEAGESLRFNERAVRTGVEGIINVMRALGMLVGRPRAIRKPSLRVESTYWVRAPMSGVLVRSVALGTTVAAGQLLARVADPFGFEEAEVRSKVEGVVIGRLNLPLAHRGDALFHIATFDAATTERLKADPEFADELDLDPFLA